MKKLFLPVAALAIFLASCGEEAAKKDSTAADKPASDTPTVATTPPPVAAPANSDVPKFSSPEMQKLADDYAAYVKESMEAAKSGDATKMQAISAKAQEWATKTQEAAAKMTPEDAKLWAEYAQKLATQMAGK